MLVLKSVLSSLLSLVQLHQAGRKKKLFAIKVVFLLCAIVIVVVVAILADYDLVMTIRNSEKKSKQTHSFYSRTAVANCLFLRTNEEDGNAFPLPHSTTAHRANLNTLNCGLCSM